METRTSPACGSNNPSVGTPTLTDPSVGGPSGCEEAAKRRTERTRTVGPTLTDVEVRCFDSWLSRSCFYPASLRTQCLSSSKSFEKIHFEIPALMAATHAT